MSTSLWSVLAAPQDPRHTIHGTGSMAQDPWHQIHGNRQLAILANDLGDCGSLARLSNHIMRCWQRDICRSPGSGQAAILWQCNWSAGSESNTSAATTQLSSQRGYNAPYGDRRIFLSSRTWRSRRQTKCSATCYFSSAGAGCRRDREIRGGRWRDRTSAPLRARRVSTPVHYRSANRPMVPARGFEPRTFDLQGRCSDQAELRRQSLAPGPDPRSSSERLSRAVAQQSWSGRRESNPSSQAWRTCVLPLNYIRFGDPCRI